MFEIDEEETTGTMRVKYDSALSEVLELCDAFVDGRTIPPPPDDTKD